MSNVLGWEDGPESTDALDQNILKSIDESSRFNFGNYMELGKYSDDLFEPVTVSDSISVSLADINDLNIIINDNECSNLFIESICQQLDMDGIEYTFTNQSDGLDIQDAVVITLDQQYVAGPRVAIIGAYQNNRNDNSDALALALDTAFKANGIDSDGIFCGRRGYRQDNQGISTRIPTPTEEAIPDDTNTSFVTIAFGTNTPSAEEIATVIEEGLGRYVAYISGKKTGDLIYRAQSYDTLGSVANRFGTAEFEVSNFNNLDKLIPSDEAIINPVEYNSSSFNAYIPVHIEEIDSNKSLR